GGQPSSTTPPANGAQPAADTAHAGGGTSADTDSSEHQQLLNQLGLAVASQGGAGTAAAGTGVVSPPPAAAAPVQPFSGSDRDLQRALDRTATIKGADGKDMSVERFRGSSDPARTDPEVLAAGKQIAGKNATQADVDAYNEK